MIFITSSEEPLLFISQSALHYMCGSFTSHLTETYYWRYRATADILIILCQYLLYCYKHLIDLHYKQQNFIIEILASAANFAQFESLYKTELFFPPYSHFISLYVFLDHKSSHKGKFFKIGNYASSES